MTNSDTIEGALRADDLATLAQHAGDQILKIQADYGYHDIAGSSLGVGPFTETDLDKKYFCHNNLEAFQGVDPADACIITGFGPTNSPTAGTFSVIMKALMLHRQTGIDTEIIISNVGAFLSRRKLTAEEADINTKRFIYFIEQELGTKDMPGVRVRSHMDRDNMGLASMLSMKGILKEDDYLAHREATDELYGQMGLLSDQWPKITDASYTVADILKPLTTGEFKDGPHGKKRVLVPMGIEEHYFVHLANLAIERFKELYPDKHIHPEAQVSGIFARLIRGFPPYPKMSKSQPDSAVNIGEAPEIIRDKIMNDDPLRQHVVLDMMQQASDWSIEKIRDATEAYEQKGTAPEKWRAFKEEYADFFIEISKKWQRAVERFPDPVQVQHAPVDLLAKTTVEESLSAAKK